MPEPPGSPKVSPQPVFDVGGLAQIIKKTLNVQVTFNPDAVTGTSYARFRTDTAGYVIVRHSDGSVHVTVGPKGRAAFTQGEWGVRWTDAAGPCFVYDSRAQQFSTNGKPVTTLEDLKSALEHSIGLTQNYNSAVAEYWPK
jgi:hypothetical protein